VAHALATAVARTDDVLPGLPEVLAQVPDPRRRRGKRYTPVFVLAVACTLAGARNFRETGDHARDLPQEVLARLGGRPAYFLFKGNQPTLQRTVYDLIQQQYPHDPDRAVIDYSHGRVIKRSLRVTDAPGLDFPHAKRAIRIRATPADLAGIARGQWGIESVLLFQKVVVALSRQSGRSA
jgi:hypothetical protein